MKVVGDLSTRVLSLSLACKNFDIWLLHFSAVAVDRRLLSHLCGFSSWGLVPWFLLSPGWEQVGQDKVNEPPLRRLVVVERHRHPVSGSVSSCSSSFQKTDFLGEMKGIYFLQSFGTARNDLPMQGSIGPLKVWRGDHGVVVLAYAETQCTRLDSYLALCQWHCWLTFQLKKEKVLAGSHMDDYRVCRRVCRR